MLGGTRGGLVFLRGGLRSPSGPAPGPRFQEEPELGEASGEVQLD